MVCDVFVLNYLKEGGLFKNFNLEVSEFTPKDLYQLNIFNNTWVDNNECLNNDKYMCQIYGKFLVEIKNFNSIPIYNNMNQRCPSQAPLYKRSNKC
jgi:hypothetical protein